MKTQKWLVWLLMLIAGIIIPSQSFAKKMIFHRKNSLNGKIEVVKKGDLTKCFDAKDLLALCKRNPRGRIGSGVANAFHAVMRRDPAYPGDEFFVDYAKSRGHDSLLVCNDRGARDSELRKCLKNRIGSHPGLSEQARAYLGLPALNPQAANQSQSHDVQVEKVTQGMD